MSDCGRKNYRKSNIWLPAGNAESLSNVHMPEWFTLYAFKEPPTRGLLSCEGLQGMQFTDDFAVAGYAEVSVRDAPQCMWTVILPWMEPYILEDCVWATELKDIAGNDNFCFRHLLAENGVYQRAKSKDRLQPSNFGLMQKLTRLQLLTSSIGMLQRSSPKTLQSQKL